MATLTFDNVRTHPNMGVNNIEAIFKPPIETIPSLDTLDFNLPSTLEAGEPPEARGLARDEVRLMVSQMANNRVQHTQFRQLTDFLEAGDVVVINTSGTLNAAVNVTRSDGMPLELHLSTQLPDGSYIIELRQPDGSKTAPFFDTRAGERLTMPGDASLILQGQYNASRRLWIAALDLPMTLNHYLDRYGFPIRYSYVADAWPSTYYQTVFATEAGSAEMPSAGRAFTPELITQLVAKGVVIAPLLLHTGVASLEAHEPPYAEYYRVPQETARQVNLARKTGNRVIAVGTTVVRALETLASPNGFVHAGAGWTELIITPERGLYAVDGMLTGLHEPEATHLAMLEALAGREHLVITYAEALQARYLWHEFGDLHLILP